MTIDLANFTPLTAFAGGAMIGLAALALMATNGRVMGISGILCSLVRPDGNESNSWRLAFVAGAMIGPLMLGLFHIDINITPVASGWILPLAGLLVGFGAALGSGCTSGHGICGLARLSPRSLVAVMTFMLTAVITVYFVRHAGVM
ncbi:YeeE/YedE thiosulfate transporter family protein [Alphaproteobacteria bacterium]|nr:YeeE/YedE thiosulfate transporter family protein [Alphaproteobacteria bacterium]